TIFSDSGNGSDASDASDGANTTDAADAALPCSAITLSFSGTVATVADHPLGLDGGVRTSAVSGSFGYRPCVPDPDPDPQRGVYQHPYGGDFSLSVGGLSIGGSGKPRVEVENFSTDTFRWRDGPILLNPVTRIMTIDGAPSSTLAVTIAITDDKGNAL